MSSSYDSNGNLTGITSDATYSYSWDAEGKPVSITRSGSTVNLTYDALGRMVEQNRGGSYTQVVYGPGGAKLALMSGSSLQRAFVPLPAGAQAVYNGSGLAYYRHGDWLGTSRLASTPSRTLYYDDAYAPYGESYSETGTTDRDFTGQNQDTHSGLYDFLYREYHPVSGRWSSPDPAGLAAVDPSNPQSWNRYAYVMNNPTSFLDPLGLFREGPGCYDEGGYPTDCGGGGGGDPWELSSGMLHMVVCFFGNCAPDPGPIGREDDPGLPVLRRNPANNVPIANCSTVLPNGRTVGDVVREYRAQLQSITAATGADAYLESATGAFIAIARPKGPIDFKNNFRGKTNGALLASAGNFAYYAIGSGILPTFELDAGAGAYGLISAATGQKPFSTLTGPMFSDASAAAARGPALAANGCQ
ncbi:MAG: RHS repeat-associated core domain-containing protein [Terriglobales bacterium]|jgi:RHS repeat-associated protein